MAHQSQDRYSSLVLAKIRSELVLKDGIVFNNDYEGSPTAGIVRIPTRDTEVTVSNYDKANGIAPAMGATSYTPLPITKDKAVNEVIDGFDAAAVPDNLVADRLDSAGYMLGKQIDTDAATVLLAGATVVNEELIDKTNIYSKIVDLRTRMSKANIPNDGRRYLLVTPDTFALILKSDEFIPASSLGDDVKQSGAVGRIAGFNVYEWNDSTANLFMIGGHPLFATRATEFSVPVHLQDLNGSGNWIGASAVQGRIVYDHKVLRSAAINAVYAPGSLAVSSARQSGDDAGKVILTVTGGSASGSLEYIVNPSSRAAYNAAYSGTELTSGTTAITAAVGDEIEVADIVSSKVVKVGYIKLAE